MQQQNYDDDVVLSNRTKAIRKSRSKTTPKQPVGQTGGCANNNTIVKPKGMAQRQQNKAIYGRRSITSNDHGENNQTSDSDPKQPGNNTKAITNNPQAYRNIQTQQQTFKRR